MKRLVEFFCILFCLLLPVVIDRPAHGEQKEKNEQAEKSAQESFEEMRRRIANEFDSMRVKTASDFETMKRKIDEDFARLLRNIWKEMALLEGLLPDTIPEPVVAPVARPGKIPPAPKPSPKDTISIPEIKPEVMPPIPPPAPPGVREKSADVHFFGSDITVRYDERFSFHLDGAPSPEAVSSAWLKMCDCEYDPLVWLLLKVKNDFALNDWGYFLIVENCANEIYQGSPNEGILFTWFMLIKSGYDARIGWSGDRLYLLLPTVSTWYGTPYYVFDGRRYYIVPSKDGLTSTNSISTYDGKYQDAKKQIDLSMSSPPRLNGDMTRKSYVFEYGQTFSVSAAVNKNLIKLYEKYPQTEIHVYCEAPMNPETRSELLTGLKRILKGKGEKEVANLLLRFVQTAFEYKRDDQQFGFEKPFYPDETLFYPYSDCEDRAVLFSYLVRNLLELEVVILDYPGHIATGVCFNEPVDGDYINYGNKKYVICDPTYIRAKCGESMAEYRNQKARVIPLTESKTSG